MATKYTLYFSDTSDTPDKAPFDLQSYTTNGPKSPSDDTLIAGATSARTTLKLWGKGLPEYGEPIFQDLIYMLENFANSSAPVFPIEGQIWYDTNFGGSPALPQLKMYDGAAWPAIITANGSSAMTGELLLSGNPNKQLGAATKQYVDSTTAPAGHTHAWADIADVTSSLVEINYVTGVTSAIQTQFDNIQTDLDNKVSIITDTLMNDTINLTFALGGEIRGLPNAPSAQDAAASGQYVDDQVTLAIAASGDGVLTNTEWLNNGLGSPLPDVFETTLRLTVSLPGSPAPTVTFDAKGISRVGHIHTAAEISFDNSFDLTYGSDVQSALEEAIVEIELLKTGGVPPSATITVERIFEVLTSPLTVAGSPVDTFTVQNHFMDDNRISLSINGVKQYTHSRGSQSINYSAIITETTPTGLNELQTYEFDIAIDGGAATTIIITGGSPVDIITHGGLVSAINTQLVGLGVTFSINDTGEIFETTSSGTGSSIVISDPGGANLYLFIGGSPNGLTDFVEVATAVDGIEGDYQETDINGVAIAPGGFSSYVVFNYDIITGSKIESLLYV